MSREENKNMEGLLYLSFIFLAFVGIPAIGFILSHKVGKIYREWREEQYNKIAREIRYMNFQNNSHNSKEREEMFRQFEKMMEEEYKNKNSKNN